MKPVRVLPVAAVIAVMLLLAGCASKAQREARLVERAQQYTAQRQYDAAIIEYRNALRLDPQSARLHFALAQSYLHNRQFALAVPELERAIALEPDFLQAQLALGELELAA